MTSTPKLHALFSGGKSPENLSSQHSSIKFDPWWVAFNHGNGNHPKDERKIYWRLNHDYGRKGNDL